MVYSDIVSAILIQDGTKPIHLASARGHTEAVSKLISLGSSSVAVETEVFKGESYHKMPLSMHNSLYFNCSLSASPSIMPAVEAIRI